MKMQLISLSQTGRLVGRAPMRAAAALAVALCLPAGQVFASWQTVAEIPRLKITVKMETADRVPKPAPQSTWDSWFKNPPPPASGWFLFNYPAPIMTSESFTFKSYKEHVVADCVRGMVGPDQFVVFSGLDGEGQGVSSWAAADAPVDLRPAVPGSVGAIMLASLCDGVAPLPTHEVLLQAGASPIPLATPAEPASAAAVPAEPSSKATQLP